MIVAFLLETMKQAKLDVDNYLPEYRKLMLYFNAKQVGIDRVEEKGDGYHIYLKPPSTIHLRRALGDDRKRIHASEIRSSLGLPPCDILFSWKITFRAVRGRRSIHTKPVRYEPVSEETVLALPFWSRARAQKIITRKKQHRNHV
jgi:hypothetical protein